MKSPTKTFLEKDAPVESSHAPASAPRMDTEWEFDRFLSTRNLRQIEDLLFGQIDRYETDQAHRAAARYEIGAILLVLVELRDMRRAWFGTEELCRRMRGSLLLDIPTDGLSDAAKHVVRRADIYLGRLRFNGQINEARLYLLYSRLEYWMKHEYGRSGRD